MKAGVRVLYFIGLAVLCLGPAQAEETIAPRPDCIPSDLVQDVNFADHTGLPWHLSNWNFGTFIRTARACRFRTITLTFYTDETGRRTARLRARTLTRMLTKRHWPANAIAVRFEPQDRAPSGVDGDGPWRAKAQIGYAEPDPAWHPSMRQPVELCSFDPASNASHCAPIPWAPPPASRTPPPPGPWDPRSVFFDRNTAALSVNAQEVAAEGLRIFKDDNFRKIVLFGQRSRDEPADLPLRRDAAVRDALVRLGANPDDIELRVTKTLGGDDAPAGEEFYDRRVTIDYED